jgi:hypothetical protein
VAKLISYFLSYWGLFQIREKFEDIKVVIISRKSKDRQHKDKQKKDRLTNNDLQTITQNNKNRTTLPIPVCANYRFWPLRNICVSNDYEYAPFVEITIRSFFHSWLVTGFVTRVTWQMPHVEQELLTLTEHPGLSGVRVVRFLLFCVMVCRSLFVSLSFF